MTAGGRPAIVAAMSTTRMNVLRIILLGACLAVLPMFTTACGGCPRNVQYSSLGDPHCPYCNAAVPDHSDQCGSCGRHFVWAEGSSACWHCGGSHQCPICQGSGKVRGSTCGICKGTGQCPDCDAIGQVRHGDTALRNLQPFAPSCWKCDNTTKCPTCGGSGKLNSEPCNECDGSGKCPVCSAGQRIRGSVPQ